MLQKRFAIYVICVIVAIITAIIGVFAVGATGPNTSNSAPTAASSPAVGFKANAAPAPASGVTRYEAEASTVVTNLPTETNWPGYSGPAYRCDWIDDGQYITFPVSVGTNGTYSVSFAYSAGSGAASRKLTVNGQVVNSNFALPATTDWNTWGKATVNLTLKAGTNQITLTMDSQSGNQSYVNLDYLDLVNTPLSSSGATQATATATKAAATATVTKAAATATSTAKPTTAVPATATATAKPTTAAATATAKPTTAAASTTRYEAEGSSISTNLPTETRWPGYSGNSYLCDWIDDGQYVTFSVKVGADSTYTLSFAYSAGSGAASRKLLVNSQVANPNFALPATADWNVWGKASINLPLKAGTNQVTLMMDSQSGNQNYINLDYLDVTGGQSISGSNPVPPANPTTVATATPTAKPATPTTAPATPTTAPATPTAAPATPTAVPPGAPSSSGAVKNVTVNATTLAQYQKFELTFDLNGISFSNPYNPDEVKVDGYFTSPSGKSIVQPGFYYQDYSYSNSGGQESFATQGQPQWKIRFSPKEAGTYRYYISVNGKNSQQSSFTVTAGSNAGFVHTSTDNPRYFAFDNGKPFIGVGLNVAWQSQPNQVSGYDYYLTQMQQNNANFARVWIINSLKQENSGWAITIQNQKLGEKYDLQQAWVFDRVLANAEAKGVYFDLNLEDVVQFSYNWDALNIYNKANGGFITDPCDLFVDASTKTMQKRLYRYLIARYGYSTSVHTWELFNEIDEMLWQCKNPAWSDMFRDKMISWHKEMADYIYSVDAHQHMVNTSTGSFKINPDLYQDLPEMNYAQLHFYFWPGWQFHPSDPACHDMAECTRYYSYLNYNSVNQKPSIIGEYGISDDHATKDTAGNSIHKTLWAGIMSGLASTPLSFDFDLHRQNPGWWQHYKALGNYLKGLDIKGLAPLKPIGIDPNIDKDYTSSMPQFPDGRANTFTASNSNLRVLGLRNQAGTTFVWVDNNQDTWWNREYGPQPASIGGTVGVQGLAANTSYTVETWDAYNGTIASQTKVTTDGIGKLNLQVSNLTRDLAYKIYR